MKLIVASCCLIAAAGISLCGAADSNSVPGAFTPAQFGREPRVHDPSTIVKSKDDYWLFVTGPGIISRHSKDLLTWSDGPRVFSSVPDWTSRTIPGNRGYFWAPDVIRLPNGYFLYYSVSTWGKNTSAIGLATNSTLDPNDSGFAWRDGGVVIQSRSNDVYNAIDPSVLLDRDNRLWLAVGSYWTGIKLVELNPQTGLRIGQDSPMYSLAWNRSIEAACLSSFEKNYYLFVNWGQCCRGTNSTYEIRVGRSANVTGPYLDRTGKDMLQGGGSLFAGSSGQRIGPGHAGILTANAKTYVSFHYYSADHGGRPRLEIVPLKWTADGWPEAGTPLIE